MGNFDQYRVIVTGAADGIGLATAELFMAQGATVLGVDLPGKTSSTSHYLGLDLTGHDAPSQLATAAEELLGGLDVLFNNAGVCPVANIEDSEDAHWDQVQDINIRAMYRLTRAAIPLLKHSPHGRVINTASLSSSLVSGHGVGAYTASKHAVAGLSKSLAVELGQYGITVNYINPGAIVTGITRELFEENADFRSFWINKCALGRLGQPEDIARSVLFLASKDAGFITGHGLTIDGGASILA
jgi:NAD(P)-dependent dehydrogenase (short-subunit alcohol dehydrogenase family)